jgi:peptidoglycan/xylan/chitin deacetylase (PgdA/CDA1 family)
MPILAPTANFHYPINPDTRNFVSMNKPFRLPVLMYHSLVQVIEHQYHRTVISLAQFEQEMAWLYAEGYRTISLEDALVFHQKNETPDKAFLLTFDDGYASTYQFALPILQKYQFTGVLFLCTGGVGTAAHPEALICNGDIPLFDRPLNWAEVKTLNSAGWQIEAHSHTHLLHATLDTAQTKIEMEKCCADITLHNTRKPIAYAYPFGSYSQTTQQVLSENYQLGFATHQGFWTAKQPLNRISRIEVNQNDTQERFSRKIRTGYGSVLEQLVGSFKNLVRSMLSPKFLK